MTSLRPSPFFQRPASRSQSPRKVIAQATASLVESLEPRRLLSSIAGSVYMDSNNDGVFDENEPGIAGVTLSLINTTNAQGETYTQTDANGLYRFDNLPVGTYLITEIQPADYLDAAGSPNSWEIEINGADVDRTGNNFGELISSSLSGHVYVDANDSGVMDPEEQQPIAGVIINLEGMDDRGYVTKIAVSDKDGYYCFTNLRPGSYTITQEQPAEYLDGKDAIGTQGGSADNDLFTGIELGVGVDGINNDFGEIAIQPPPPPPPPPVVITTATLAGRVLTDITGDGLTSDDAPLGQVTVKLFLDRNGNGMLDDPDGAPIATTSSDALTGAYSFTGLQPGRYFVKSDKPSGYVPTAPVLAHYYTVDATAGLDLANLDFANFKKPDRHALTDVIYTINGKKTTHNLRGKVHEGDWIQVSFTVRPGHTLTLSLVSYSAPSSKFVAAEASSQQLFQSQTQTFGPGKYKLQLGVYVPKTCFQVDFVIGSVIPQFGPAKSNISYSAQHRLISTSTDFHGRWRNHTPLS